MKHKDVEKIVTRDLQQDEMLLGYFYGTTPLNFWLFLLIGPLFLVSRVGYYVHLTDYGMHFYRQDLYKRIIQHDYFSYAEVKNFVRTERWFGTMITFYFPNHRRLRLFVERQPDSKPAVFRRAFDDYIRQQLAYQARMMQQHG